MNIYQPYTYLITHIPTGKRYYGVRFARGCHPSDLGTKYFSSSKIINSIIKKHGKDVFLYEVRRTFDTALKAKIWEHKVLTRLRVELNDNWYNLTNGHPPQVMTEKKRIAKANLGSHWKGKKRPPEFGSKVSAARKGMTFSDETKQKLSDALKGKPLSDETKAKMKGRTPWNKGKRGLQVAWNKGISKSKSLETINS